jgi:hypothetical protein
MLLRANILEKIQLDHARIRILFKQILEIQTSDRKRKDLYGDLRRELTLHAMLEDEAVYPHLKANPATEQWIRISVVQHATQDRLMTQLDALAYQNPSWARTMAELHEHVSQHMQVEEIELGKLVPPPPVLSRSSRASSGSSRQKNMLPLPGSAAWSVRQTTRGIRV